MKSTLLLLFNVFTGINQQAFAVDSARSSSSSPINHSVNSADSPFKSSDNVAMGTEDHPAANFATKHKKDVSDTMMRTLFHFISNLSHLLLLFSDNPNPSLLQKKTSAVIPSMNSQASLTSVHLLDLHRQFRGSKLTATAPAQGAERLLKKKKKKDSPKRMRQRVQEVESKGGKSGQTQSQVSAEAEESNRALEICEKDRVELRWERDMLQKELETCEKKVDELQAKLDEPEYLFAQQADQCKIGRNEEGKFYLESSEFLDQTEAFTDRPFQLEEALSTSDWFPEGFNERFENSEDGWPNSAIALVDDNVSQGIYVSAFVSAYAKEDGTFGYLLQQSDQQAAVKPLEDLLPGGLTETTKDHCALFIDGGCTDPCVECVNAAKEYQGQTNGMPEYSICQDIGDSGKVNGEFYSCWKDTVSGDFCWTRSVKYVWFQDYYYSCKPKGDWACVAATSTDKYPTDPKRCGPPCQNIDDIYNCPNC